MPHDGKSSCGILTGDMRVKNMHHIKKQEHAQKKKIKLISIIVNSKYIYIYIYIWNISKYKLYKYK